MKFESLKCSAFVVSTNIYKMSPLSQMCVLGTGCLVKKRAMVLEFIEFRGKQLSTK